MRLTKLKLAGFKSFVDPTTVMLPGQLVGVVGPNGCGKSNIMDAVRWVLGESKASELRGESMQDVIFNGSGNRKPVSRASVELIFDNSLGRALGQWSQYAELSVKRVLTRTGQSDYLINNLKVRRKDITDLFLGTGLGPRAYAIIGQGMIARIIEAKPDELRVFLEEAAGVTRYKERRKETEGRLADTRENLTRVEDIRQELGAQMEKLESQAEVAREYQTLHAELTGKQHLLWLLRRNDARTEADRLNAEIGSAEAALEAQMAAVREVETKLEEAREGHFGANDALHASQSEMFAANAEATRLESDIRHRREQERQLEARLAQLLIDRRHWELQIEQSGQEQGRWEELQAQAETRVELAGARLEAQQDRLPEAETRQADAQERLNQVRQRVSTAEQRVQLEQAHRANADRALAGLAQRRERLGQERQNLAAPDATELELAREQLTEAQEDSAAAAALLAEAQAALPAVEADRRAAWAAQQLAVKERAEAQARMTALEQLQQRVQGSGRLADWLKQHGLAGAEPLWRQLHVDAAWEDAVEAVLRERLNAVAAEPALLEQAGEHPPGAKITLLLESGDAALRASPGDSLLRHVRCDSPRLQATLGEWLHGIRVADSLTEALTRRGELAPGERFVLAGGHLVDRHAVTLFAPDAQEHGLLERQREIDGLAVTLVARQEAADAAHARVVELDRQLAELGERIQTSRRQHGDAQSRAHAAQVQLLRLEQGQERYRERCAQLDEQLADLRLEEEGERERLLAADSSQAEQREVLAALHEEMADAREHVHDAERELREVRDAIAGVERELREAEFSQRECQSKLESSGRSADMAQAQLQRIDQERDAAQAALAASDLDELEPQLQAALLQREACETALTAARDALEAATQRLRTLEEQRLRGEQGVAPLRDKIGEQRLKAQAAQINAEQFATQLVDAKADEAALAPLLAGARPGALSSAINQLQAQIAALGAVNLAALQELEAARQRKGYLDDQAADLVEAMTTLENAIRRIDRETRELLQETFDTVNGHFAELFPMLFGGGEARLIMTGEEILDAGVQVMAQPPGKKNSTIHLLSGGEKALTAIALVFAMFQLNPAPFCLLDEVDAPLDDTNTERFCRMVQRMSAQTQFLFISHSKITMEMAEQLVGVTMQESGVSRIVEVDIEEALRMREQVAA